jgi:hypothetical protein
MSLPTTINPSSPGASDSPSQGDDQIRALKQFLVDMFGWSTDPTSLTGAPFTVTAAGSVGHPNGLIAGTASSPSLFPTSNGNTGIYFPATNFVNMALGGSAAFQLFYASGTRTAVTLRAPDEGAAGPIIIMLHDSTSPANNDVTGTIAFQANSGGLTWTLSQIYCNRDDVNTSTMDSSLVFTVQSNASSADANVAATLSSLGVWTDASSADIKEYFDHDLGSVTDKMKELSTLGVYRGKDTPLDKQADAEIHLSPTAEQFYSVFGLGTDPDKSVTPGIAPKDVAWLAVKLAMEIDARVTALEGKK